MIQVGIKEAQKQLSQLIDQALGGEVVVIGDEHGAVQVVPLTPEERSRAKTIPKQRLTGEPS